MNLVYGSGIAIFLLVISYIIYIIYCHCIATTSHKITNYYATWCGYSQKFLPIWEEFKLLCKEKYPQIICEEVICDNSNKCQSAGVNAFPTIVLETPNKPASINSGYKQLDDLLKLTNSYFTN